MVTCINLTFTEMFYLRMHCAFQCSYCDDSNMKLDLLRYLDMLRPPFKC